MGIYMPNMEKPKNAFNCSIKINPEERRCIYTGKVFEETLSLLIDRPCDDCPLIEIDESDTELLQFFNEFEYWKTSKEVVKYISAVYGERSNATQRTHRVESVGERRADDSN